MPRGSRACFTVRWSARTSLETASGHQRCLARPMPCSPVIAPPQAMTCANSSSSAASTAPFGAGLSVIHHHVGVDVAVAGVAEAGDRQAVLLLQPRGEARTGLPAGRAGRRCPRSAWSGRCRAGHRRTRGGSARPLRIGPAPRPRSTNSGFWRRDELLQSRISPRTERSWPSSSTIRWARQPRRRSLLVRLEAAASVKASASFQRGGQEAGGEDGVQRADGGAHGAETDGQAGAITAAAAAASAWLR